MSRSDSGCFWCVIYTNNECEYSISFRPSEVTETLNKTDRKMTKHRGYYDLKTVDGTKTLHFAANCWLNLLEDTKMEFDVFTKNFMKAEEEKDILGVVNYMTDVIFAAAKAYDQEKGNEVDYNWFNVRNWVGALGEAEGAAITETITSSVEIPKEEKKGK